MKKLSAYFLFAAFLSVFTNSSFAQRRTKTKHARVSQQSHQPIFIEDIEIGPAERGIELPAAQIINASPVSASNAFVNMEALLPVQFKYALVLNRNVESINNISLYNFVDDWMATRYRFGGVDKHGVDCSGFTEILFNKVYSLSLPRTAREQYALCEKHNRDQLKEGDLVFFNTRGGVSHVGVFLGDGYFVHASTANGVTINNLEDDYYGARFLGGGNIPANSNESHLATAVSK